MNNTRVGNVQCLNSSGRVGCLVESDIGAAAARFSIYILNFMLSSIMWTQSSSGNSVVGWLVEVVL